ncbi:hypothetical protein U8527_21355 [Kordia algicida OT-1]|uniref:Uncharacterized protein n=1 Tax=Kordia algicida OT-1 TaxID=391587 RepID=A9DLG2_9FLAO|nr:hypothetical protein [Kordia algicida]EDP98560.1 hypothetical protein KAOT1_15122 [Kordia algicida OT-1]
MKKLKRSAVLTLVVLMNLSLYNCSKDDNTQEEAVESTELSSIKTYLAEKAHNSTLDPSRIDVVIFDEFKPFIQEGFDLSNEDEKMSLLYNLPADLAKKAQDLREYFVLVRKNEIEVANEVFANSIAGTINAVKSTLIDNRITDLNVSSTLQDESCSYSSIIVGYYYNYYYGVNMPIYSTGPFSCTSNRAVFYEGNNYSGDILFTIDASINRSINFKNYSQYDNDEARSIKFWNFSPGQVVRVFDSPSGSTNDDFTVFRFFTGVDTTEQAPTFEQNFSSSDFTQTFFEDNGLDGKVSSVRFSGN